VNEDLPLLEQYLAHQGFLTTNGFMISRDNMIKHGMYAEDLTNMEDVDLFLRLPCSLDFNSVGDRRQDAKDGPIRSKRVE